MNWAVINAGSEIRRIINQPTSATLSYVVGKKLIPENEESNKYKRNGTLTSYVCPIDSCNVPASLAIERNKSKENAIVFYLEGDTFDITLLNISKNIQGQINF